MNRTKVVRIDEELAMLLKMKEKMYGKSYIEGLKKLLRDGFIENKKVYKNEIFKKQKKG